MSNRIEEATLPAGTKLRVGTPADRPQEAIEACITFFSTKENVVYAGLGLMEVIYPDGKSEVSYTIGIQCSSDEAGTIQQAAEVLLKVPPARWPISIVPAQSQFSPTTYSHSSARNLNAVGSTVCCTLTSIRYGPNQDNDKNLTPIATSAFMLRTKQTVRRVNF
jgi:hypothetical protein